MVSRMSSYFFPGPKEQQNPGATAGGTAQPTSTTLGPSATKAPTKTTYQRRTGMGYGGLFMLVVLPWAIFASVLGFFSFPFHNFQRLTWLLVFGAYAFSGYFLTHQAPRGGSASYYTYLGMLCLLACTLATVLGLYNYHEFMFSFFAYDEFREYGNVLPSEPAASKADAGKIIFSSDARVDTTKAVGYVQNDVYCVAPILDDTQSTTIQFWAAGVNCCGKRADFSCDSSWDSRARSGVVVLDNDSWMPSHHDTYMKAVEVAEAAFDLISAKEPIFVRWVLDPQAIQDDFWRKGAGFFVVGVGVYLVLNCIFATVLHRSSQG